MRPVRNSHFPRKHHVSADRDENENGYFRRKDGEPFAMTRPAISQHLRVLEQAGLVVEKRVGREHHYQLRAAPLSKWVQQYDSRWS